MTLTQQTGPYAHWEYIHPESGDRLRIVPERGGICLLYTSDAADE